MCTAIICVNNLTPSPLRDRVPSSRNEAFRSPSHVLGTPPRTSTFAPTQCARYRCLFSFNFTKIRGSYDAISRHHIHHRVENRYYFTTDSTPNPDSSSPILDIPNQDGVPPRLPRTLRSAPCSSNNTTWVFPVVLLSKVESSPRCAGTDHCPAFE